MSEGADPLAVAALPVAEQARLTAGSAMWTTAAVPAAGIPALRMSDGPMGIASPRVDERDVARLTPCAAALGASFDVALVRRVGALVGAEAVRNGVDLVLAPNLNLARSPLAGRAFEYFSEDPLVAGVLGAGWIAGLQSAGTGAVPKHLVCNDSETDRDRVDVRVGARALREIYLLPFELAAAAGAAAMLTPYNRVNGQWCSEQADVTAIVKQEWGFAGPLVSDWFGTHSTAGALTGGLDLEMPGPGRFLAGQADVPFPSEADGMDFEGEFGIVTSDVPMGCPAEAALAHVLLVLLVNDWSLRAIAPVEMKTGFGWVQARPACSVAPFAVTPDALGDAWRDGRVCLPLTVSVNGTRFGHPDGAAMAVGFDALIAHAARTRDLPAGTIIGSGTVSNPNHAEVGSTCISERRAIETIADGHPTTPFLRFVDRVAMHAGADATLFGPIDQQVVAAD